MDIFSRPEPVRGIIAIRNLKTNQTYLKETEDAVASFKDERFALDLSMHPSPELQKDYTETGLELFTIELDTEASPTDNLLELLEKRKAELISSGITLYN